MITVKVVTLSHYDQSFALPSYETSGAAGADVRACLGNGEKMIIKPGERVLVPTGLSMEIPHGYEIQVRPRSGLSLKTKLRVTNSPGTIDSCYRGELKIIMENTGEDGVHIVSGDRVAQIVLCEVPKIEWQEVQELTETDRGEGGFGSTGTK